MPTESARLKDHPGVPIAPPLLFLLPILAAIPLEWLCPTFLAAGAVRWISGGLFVVLGIALDIAGFVTQRRAGTDPIPYRPTTRIISHGVYRFTRNPMYVGFALCTLGLAILFDSLWILAAVPIGLVLTNLLIVAREERYLERKFGDEYRDYQRRVRRWL
ncbi:MAG: methyltransferase family protein [Chthoniobacterales bacterium]